jgi:Xaa-Pro aminopeptidase
MTIDRHRGVIPALDELGADVAIVASPANRCYLTGFTGDLGAATTRDVVLASRDRRILLTYPIHTGWATAESLEGVEIRGHRDWIESAAETVKEAGWRSVAIDDTAIPHAGAVKLRDALPDDVAMLDLATGCRGSVPGKMPVSCSAMRRSALITDEVLVDAAGWIEAGMTERAVARRINEASYRLGADDLAFTVIVASGPNAAQPAPPPNRPHLRGG